VKFGGGMVARPEFVTEFDVPGFLFPTTFDASSPQPIVGLVTR